MHLFVDKLQNDGKKMAEFRKSLDEGRKKQLRKE